MLLWRLSFTRLCLVQIDLGGFHTENTFISCRLWSLLDAKKLQNVQKSCCQQKTWSHPPTCKSWLSVFVFFLIKKIYILHWCWFDFLFEISYFPSQSEIPPLYQISVDVGDLTLAPVACSASGKKRWAPTMSR